MFPQKNNKKAHETNSGFNYAYRRTATVSATPNSSVSALPPAQSSTQPPTKGPTPVPDRPLPPHLANNKSTTSTPPPTTTTAVDQPATGKASPLPTKPNGSTPSDKDKEKAKRKEKKERKDKERAAVEGTGATNSPDVSISAPAAGQEPSTSATPDRGATPAEVEEVKSPVEGSTGTRTPKTGKPPRHPWTIFMRMAPHLQIVEADIREFFGDAKNGVRFDRRAFIMHTIFTLLFIIIIDYPC